MGGSLVQQRVPTEECALSRGAGDVCEYTMAQRVRVTCVRRCLEEARGGLELAWRGSVAAALQQHCQIITASPYKRHYDTCNNANAASVLKVTVEGHTTPAVRDIGRGSLRVRFDECESETKAPPPVGGLVMVGRCSLNTSA